MTTTILERMKKADKLPSLPAVAIEVLQLTQADDLSVPAIANVIQRDPALTAKVLRLVNSSLFGVARRIASLPQAMAILGLRTVKVLVLSFSLVDMANRPGKASTFDHRMYWRRSLTTATVARLLALRIDKDLGDAAFVGGLLCDIGILAATQYAEEVYLPAIASYRQGEKPLHAVEQETLGLTHEDLSTTLLKHWSLPDEICQAVQTHHHPLTPDSARRDAEPILTRILRASALLADLFVGDTLAGNLPHVTQQVAQGIPLPEEDLDNVLKNLDGQVQEIASMLELDIGSTLAYHEIQAAATTQLASLSMEAELHAQKLANQNRKLAEEATTDKLTGIANRAALDDHFAAVCKRCRDNQSPIALILLDLDHFKRINDTFGHTAGDQVLSHVGQVLKQFQSTSRLAGRYGGEEFAVVAENITKEQLRTLAESIRTKVARITVPNDAKPVRVTASLGAAHMKPGDPNLSVATLIERADTCLYQAKNSGRNRVMYAGSRRVIDLETEQAAAS